MSIDVIKKGLGAVNRIQSGGVGIEKISKTPEPAKESFSDMLGQAVKEVDSMQKHADRQIKGIVMGEEGVSTHDAMIALEKADIAFQLMNQVRAKIIRAYEEILRTQV